MTEKYDEWLATSKHEFTDGGNMKPVPRRTVVQWVVPVWKDVKSKMVANSFKQYAVKTKWDAREDEKTLFFKEKKPCHHGKKVLDANEIICLSETKNPFKAPKSLKVMRKKPRKKGLSLMYSDDEDICVD